MEPEADGDADEDQDDDEQEDEESEEPPPKRQATNLQLASMPHNIKVIQTFFFVTVCPYVAGKRLMTTRRPTVTKTRSRRKAKARKRSQRTRRRRRQARTGKFTCCSKFHYINMVFFC